MSISHIDLQCIGNMDAVEGLALAGIDPLDLEGLDIIDFGAGLGDAPKILLEATTNCYITAIDTIYETPQLLDEEVRINIEGISRDVAEIVKGNSESSYTFQMEHRELFQKVMRVCKRRIATLQGYNAPDSLFTDYKSEKHGPNGSTLIRKHKLTPDMKGEADIIFVTSVFYHSLEPYKFLETLDEYLAPDGKIVIIDPQNGYDPWKKSSSNNGHGVRKNIYYLTGYARKKKKEYDEQCAPIIEENQSFMSWVKRKKLPLPPPPDVQILGKDDTFIAFEIKKGAYKDLQFPLNETKQTSSAK